MWPFAVVERVTDRERWAATTEERWQDLLVYLALARCDERPTFADLTVVLQSGIKGLLLAGHRPARREAWHRP